MKILFVCAEYYPEILKLLTISANDIIKKESKNLEFSSIRLIKVPGIFEIPVVIAKNIKKYDAFIALGCVIKGETPHFDLISQSVTNAIMNLSITYKKPIGNGIITCLNKKQALERSGIYKKNKASEATKATLSVLGILKSNA